MIQDEKFKHYDTFVYLTKQHSAVHGISSEIEDKKKRGELNDVEIINQNKNNFKISNILDSRFSNIVFYSMIVGFVSIIPTLIYFN